MDSSLGRRSGGAAGVMRLRRDRRADEWRECSTSEEERDREAAYQTGLASILAGYARGDRDPYPVGEELAVTERRPPSGSNSPTLPAHYRHHSPSRQASPYPIESTNLTSGASTPQPSLSPRFVSRPSGYKKSSGSLHSHGHGHHPKSGSGTLGSRRKNHVTSSSSVTSSASSDNCCQSDVTYPEVDRRHDLVEESGEQSPPEPAPPEVPPRGPSLHNATLGAAAGHRARTTPDGTGPPPYVFPTQVSYEECPLAEDLKQDKGRKEYNKDYLMSGSPRSYGGGKSPDYPTAAELNAQAAQHHHRLGSTLSSTATAGGGVLVSAPSAPPAVMPVFPLRPSASSTQQPQYSPYSPSRFHIDKRCRHRCSWKCCSIALILLSVALTAMLAYFGAVNSMRSNLDPSSCILVEDAKVVADDQMARDSTASVQTPTEESLPTSTAVHYPSPSQAASSDQGQFPQMDVDIDELKAPHRTTIPPAQFWNIQFRNKQPAFIRFNMSLPWGANFAVYGRRNVAPSITQYDFSEFVKGGRVDHRIKRESTKLLADFQHAVSFTPLTSENTRLRQQMHHYSPTFLGEKGKNFEEARMKREAHWDLSENIEIDKSEELDTGPVENHLLSKRSTDGHLLVNVSLLQYLDTGRWFMSVYNDDLQVHEVILTVEEAEGISTSCPNDCSGHGSCYLGKCDCIDGFEGIDCSKSVCPVLCSNHGKYGGGLCHCEEGWKGAECDIPLHDCQVADCSGHGRCVRGTCACHPGWKGPACNVEDCVDPECSGHGSCVLGRCYCKAGWQGVNCSQVDQKVYQCLPGCSEHGAYDLETGSCICEEFWTGADCSQAVCSLDCGLHGRCDQGQCVCLPGWSGERCDLLPCDSRCAEHGQCKNGTCVCSQGWNGRHCTLPGCVNACNRHGSCMLVEGEYQCQCGDGWAGIDCSVPLEMECNDELDNDGDGMVDCSDSECCTHPACNEHIMCLASNDPVEVLLRKQPPSVTASFYQRVKFLVEENSVQSYVHQDEYTERRVSVMRGQVLSPQGLGIVGIRVSVDRDSRFGFTLTRAGGWFDVLVNGGGAVTLQFQRSPFQPLTRTLFVPWNQIVVLPPITMQLEEDDGFRGGTHPALALALGAPSLSTGLHLVSPCMDHDNTVLMPVVLSTWMPEKVGGLAGKSLVLAETQMLQESILIPGSGLHLMYRSSLASGYLSRVVMRLTHSAIPLSLARVHVRVEIEGSVHTRTYEADPNLSHTFAWNKRNVYKQKVYGVAQAKISVGYEHVTCQHIVWETQTAMLQGFDVDISDVGGWSLDIHHHYNFHEGILQKGDGSTLHLKQFPRTVRVVMGTGLQRPLVCKDCDGPARDARLLTPVALTSGPDGSLYVGDFNLVRRLTPQGNVYTVLQLSATQVSYQYYLSLSPADGRLYISDPERHQILRVLSLDSVADPAVNWEPAVGSGERCIPGDDTSCGDEGPAIAAKLAHPKGLAMAADKTMYFADGTNIRSVDPDGIIHTLIGHHRHLNVWQPIPCQGAIPAQQAQLQWPTGLSLSPLDGSLHFIDDRLVLKLTADMKVKVVAGTPLHCHPHKEDKKPSPARPEAHHKNQISEDDISSTLGQVLALAFSPNGQLFIADSDSRKVNAIRVVDPAGRMADFAGRGYYYDKRDCDCLITNSSGTVPCQCWTEASGNSRETLMSTTARFTSISAIAVSPDGVVNIADQGNLHILALEHYLASHDENGEFRIPYTPTGEEYIFNRYGQHIATRDITTGKPRYSFLYSKNTSFGKLSTVTDSAGNKILFLRDYSNVVSAIENTQDHKCELNISGVGFLTKFLEKGRSEVVLDYDSNTGLLTSRADLMAGGGSTFLYQYDGLGRVSHVVLPTGESLNLASRLTADDQLEVQVSSFVSTDASTHVTTIRMEGYSDKRMIIREGLNGLSEAVSFRNGSFALRHASGSVTTVSAEAKHPLLELALPVEAEMFPLWSRQSTSRGSVVNNMAWTYSLVGDAGTSHQTIHRQLWVSFTSPVNNSRVIGVIYEQMAGKETILDREKDSLLKVSFDAAGLPLSWQPGGQSLPVNITYDRFNRLESWTWGVQSEHYSYDRHGLLAEVKTKQDGATQFTYNDGNMLSHITLPSGRKFTLAYDELGGLRHVTLPSGTRHSFSAQPSIGFVRYTYTPPGSTRAYLQHFTHAGLLLQTVYPGDGARVLYRYHKSYQLSEVVHGDGITEIKHLPNTNLPSQILHSEKDFEYRWDYQYSGGLLTEERLEYSPKTGLSNAKFTYQYDDNFRVTSVTGRVGGQSLPEHLMQYSTRTGAKQLLGQFTVSWPQDNETSLSDGTAVFNRITNTYFQIAEVSVTIHRMEVFRMEFAYDSRNRISQTRTYTRNVGVNMYTNIKNMTWDADGQLAAVEAQEPWGFKYDANGNMLSLTYRGNTIPMEYNVMDRIVKFGEGLYRYDNRGLVVQNAREEKFHYNAKGLLIRATKRGRFDVKYYYDHLDRLATRKDNYGNVTQFFYTNHQRLNEVSQIYSPRDGKLMTLVYDDRGHLIFAQVYRHKYYIATDQCGTPIMVFNQYGEGIREIMRSPYGHIVYDSNPYLYLPVDFCGGLLDQVTSLVHMSGGKVYDPLIGQWMSPMWGDVLNRVTSPRHLHLYRFNGNDPINVGQSRQHLADEESWLSGMGYDLASLAPQLSPKTGYSMGQQFRVASGFLSQLSQKMMTRGLSSLSLPEARMRLDPFSPGLLTSQFQQPDVENDLGVEHMQSWQLQPGSLSEPPFGRGILVSRQAGHRAVVHSVPTANAIYRDVITSVFNNTFLLPFTLVAHGALQDAFYFVKEDAWRAQEDRAQLKRFGSQFNTTFHEKDGEAGSGKVLDVRIHRPNAVINLRYGTTLGRERQRLLHHCKAAALRKAWHRERDALRNNVPAAWDWTQQEADEILKQGAANGYDGEYIRDAERYPELAEDPYNIRFVKKAAQSRR